MPNKFKVIVSLLCTTFVTSCKNNAFKCENANGFSSYEEAISFVDKVHERGSKKGIFFDFAYFDVERFLDEKYGDYFDVTYEIRYLSECKVENGKTKYDDSSVSSIIGISCQINYNHEEKTSNIFVNFGNKFCEGREWFICDNSGKKIDFSNEYEEGYMGIAMIACGKTYHEPYSTIDIISEDNESGELSPIMKSIAEEYPKIKRHFEKDPDSKDFDCE